MKRLALVLFMLAMSLPGPSSVAAAAIQPGVSPTPEPLSEIVSEPVTVGDWTFQVIELERRDSYYGENFAEVFQPQGVELILGISLRQLHRLERQLPFRHAIDLECVFTVLLRRPVG